jgi:hypothetical protein
MVEIFHSISLAENKITILQDGNGHARNLPIGADLFNVGFDVGNILLREDVLCKRARK